MDYYSVILNDDTNKCIDLPAKKIHSTNQMTLFIKKDIYPVIGKDVIEKEKLLELIDKYFNTIKLSEDKFMEIYQKSKYRGIGSNGTKNGYKHVKKWILPSEP